MTEDLMLRIRREWFKHNLLTPTLAVALLITGTPSLASQRPDGIQQITIGSSPPPSDLSSNFSYIGGTAVSPSGDKIGVTQNYLTFNNRPWLPVMGEFHFSRYPEEGWEDEILKMKAGGVQIISTYIIWIHHEEIEDSFDWSGQRNLRHFVELCQKHGMYVYPRIGPWVHGEVRNGGFPDWVIEKSKPRENDPRYLSFVNQFDHEIAAQLRGLLWKDGGPVIGIQLENEYSNNKPNGGPAHILELKRLARANGLDVPLYTVTGWDNAVYPEHEVLPVYGAYADAPWDPSNKRLPPNEAYVFRFGNRVSGNMGAIPGPGTVPREGTLPEPTASSPFMTAEVGAGLQDTYHRRPVVTEDDVAAIPEVLIGSGANLLGYYMYHGGENPQGKLSTLNESRATHYSTDVPVKSYDFQAPLGEFGQERPSFNRLKLLNYFLNDFGSLLAPMIPSRPSVVPTSASDLSVPRVSARTSQEGGFLFVNNYVRGTPTPERSHLQTKIVLNGHIEVVPESPIDVPAGAYFILPVGIDIEGSRLNYSTAQLFTKLQTVDTTTYFFFAVPGVAPVFSFSNVRSEAIVNLTGKKQVKGTSVTITELTPSNAPVFELKPRLTGRNVRIVLLTRDQAARLTKVTLTDGPHLVDFAGTVFNNGDQIHLQSTSGSHFNFGVYPDIPMLKVRNHSLQRRMTNGLFVTYSAEVPEEQVSVQAVSIAPSIPADPQTVDTNSNGTREIQSPPADSVFSSAPRWKLILSSDFIKGLSNVYLNISYKGDVARLSDDGALLSDNFYNGTFWTVGLRYFAPQIRTVAPVLTILPLRKGNDVVFEDDARLDTSHGKVVELDHISVVPEYQLILEGK